MSMLILSPHYRGLVVGIPCTMHSLTETQTDFGKCMNPMGVGQAPSPTIFQKTNLSMSSYRTTYLLFPCPTSHSFVASNALLTTPAAFLISSLSQVTFDSLLPMNQWGQLVLPEFGVGTQNIVGLCDVWRHSWRREDGILTLSEGIFEERGQIFCYFSRHSVNIYIIERKMSGMSVEEQEGEETREQVVGLLGRAFNGCTQQEQKEAEQRVMTLLKQPSFFRQLYSLLLSITGGGGSPQGEQVSRSACILIKKYSYDYSKVKEDRSVFVEMLYNLVTLETLGYACKDLLGTALEYQFITDAENNFRRTAAERSLTLLVLPGEVSLEGHIMVCLAYLNSLDEIEDQIDFFEFSLPSLSRVSFSLKQQAEEARGELLQKKIIPRINKLLELVETAVERAMDDEQFYQHQLTSIRQNPSFLSLLQTLAPLFGHEGSLLSRRVPSINQAKRVIANIISMLYSNFLCPPALFDALYLTFLLESQVGSHSPSSEAVIITACEVLSLHLARRYHYERFADNIPATIMAVFMYSVTTQQEGRDLERNPEEFSDLAEYYVEGEDKFYSLKVKASVLLQALAEKVDGALRNMIDIVTMIMIGALEQSEQDSPIFAKIKREADQVPVGGLTKAQKLQTSLLMLSSIATHVNQRLDIGQVVYALLIAQFSQLSQCGHPLVALRLMRAISCYSVVLYFSYIEQQMDRGRVFLIEGLKCFARIIRNNKLNDLFESLSATMSHLISKVRISDDLVDLIVLVNYKTMVISSPQLFQAILTRIRDEFLIALSQKQQSEALISLNYLYSLIKKETISQRLHQLTALFFSLAAELQGPQKKEMWDFCDNKVVETYEIVLSKSQFVHQEVDQFVSFSLSQLNSLDLGSPHFRFYNLYIFSQSGANYKMVPLFQAFWSQLEQRFMVFQSKHEYSQGISYFCFLMSEILANYITIDLSEANLRLLVAMADQLPPDYQQYPLMVFLTYLYHLPFPTLAFLQQHALYDPFLKGILKVRFDGVIPKRIFILAIIKLLEIEENPHNLGLILGVCVEHMKKLLRQPRRRVGEGEGEVKRRFEELKEGSKKGRGEQENELVNLFGQFKHPFSGLSEFDQFKFIFYQNNHAIHQLSSEMRESIAAILETQWVENQPRRIVTIKK